MGVLVFIFPFLYVCFYMSVFICLFLYYRFYMSVFICQFLYILESLILISSNFSITKYESSFRSFIIETMQLNYSYFQWCMSSLEENVIKDIDICTILCILM